VQSSTANLVLSPDAPIDFQMHTTLSDGRWEPVQLVEHLAREGFGLAAITDHERVDTQDELQRLAAEHHMPILVAAEMTTDWKGWTDVLCFGFTSGDSPLAELSRDVYRRQSDNTREVYAEQRRKGVALPEDPAALDAILKRPAAGQPFALAELILKCGFQTDETSLWTIAYQAGCRSADNEIAAVVDAGHRSGALCLIAHPGRGGENPVLGPAELDELHAYAPFDGIEAYYPLHKPEQIEAYVDYAKKHNLLTSSGSDSHSPDKPPIKYRAELSRALLERVGIRIES
jgi:predicted metal-dependent phosphoesterase TrpH